MYIFLNKQANTIHKEKKKRAKQEMRIKRLERLDQKEIK